MAGKNCKHEFKHYTVNLKTIPKRKTNNINNSA